MKKSLALVFILASSMTLAACGGSSTTTETSVEPADAAADAATTEVVEDVETVMLTVSHVFAEDHPVNVAYQEAADELYEKTDGRYGLTIYPNGTYANYADGITSCQMGTLDIACLDSASDWLESAGVLFAPYCFDSYDHWANFKASDLSEEIRAEVGTAVGDVVQLNMYNFGFRNLTANKEVRTVEDLEGSTLRCVNFEPYSTLKDVFEVPITSIPIEDVYMSLQTGVADCEENPLTQIVTMKFYEVQDYLMETQHMLAVSSTIINKSLWEGMSADDQAIFMEVFTNQGNRVDQLTVENEEALIAECEANGMTVIRDMDTSVFQANAAKVVENYPAWQEWYAQIQELK